MQGDCARRNCTAKLLQRCKAADGGGMECAGLKKIHDEYEGFGAAGVFQAVGDTAVEEKGITLMKRKNFFVDLVFDISFKNVFAFKSVGADHLFAARSFFKFQQYDVCRLGGDGTGEDAFIGKPLYRFFGEHFFLAPPDDKDLVIIEAVLHIFEKSPKVLFKRMDDLE